MDGILRRKVFFCEREVRINYAAFLMNAIVSYSWQRYAVVQNQIALMQLTESLSIDGTNSIITALSKTLKST